jgi:hypothetical protein
VLGLLGTLAVALAAAFVVAPSMLAASMSGVGFAGERRLAEASREAFVAYWTSGDRTFPPSLERVVEYWFRYHVVKALIAAILLVVLVVLDTVVWKAFLRAGGLGRVGRAAAVSGGILVTMLAVLSLVTVMANVQGAAAPFASLLPMLEVGGTSGELTEAVNHIRQWLTEWPGTGLHRPPAIEVMVNDFSRYHVVLAVVAAVVAFSLAAMTGVFGKRFARAGSSEGRTRRVVGSFGVLSAALSLVMIVLAIANATTAANPAPALLAFFEGGW